MQEKARDLMRGDVRSIDPDMLLVDLERAFMDDGAPAFPVLRDGELVGIVSRSDVVRQLCVEQSRIELLQTPGPQVGERDPDEEARAIGRKVGDRIGQLRARDLMIRDVVTVSPDASVAEMAAIMVDKAIHELVVVDAGRVVGLATSLDVLALLTRGSA